MIKVLFVVLFVNATIALSAQTLQIKDSSEVRLHPSYNDVSSIHKKLFGENYRKEWAAKTKLPIIKISEISSGLQPTELGGGHQSHSLRLKDKAGIEWVLRSVEKYSEGLAPEVIHGSVYEKWVDDNFSAQHPYSALIVPVLAEAVNVPHTNPIIGIVAPDKALGQYAKEFEGTVCLLELREPEGDSDNTIKMLSKLDEDNDNKVDSSVFFRARLLDLLIADWGRHEDQWRWVDLQKGDGKNYLVVPRDRDQVFYVNEGFLPKAVASTSLLSFLEGFNPNYKDVNAFFINGRKLNQQFLNQYTYEEWMQMTNNFVKALPDRILMNAVDKLPASSKSIRKELIFNTLKGRRDNMVGAMEKYYRFLYSITDIRTSDKTELVEMREDDRGRLIVNIYKLSKSGKKDQTLFSNTFQPDITKELRLFTGKGDDVFKINLPTSKIKIRIVGGEGQKTYEVTELEGKVDVYENRDNDKFIDNGRHFALHSSNDTLNTKKVFTNLYTNSTGIAPTVDIRSVDGVFGGLGYKVTKEGFRREPYGSMQKFSVLKNFNSTAFLLQYNAEWISVLKNTDLTINGFSDFKGNILNFFGRGNETDFDQTGDFRTFYRVKYSYLQLDPQLRFNISKTLSLSAGPSFQYFRFSTKDNLGRYINDPGITSQFENLSEDKSHAGLSFNFSWDRRDNKVLPSKGLNFTLKIQGFEGLNKYSEDYAQIFPQLSVYKSFYKGKIVFANRVGGGLTFGQTAFYQSAFLGSQDNLLGYRKFRFAGDHLAYNNFETRITVPNFLHYILPGKIGLIGFYDAGRVWAKYEKSATIHQGYGAGIFIAPFNRLFIRAVAGYSDEGLQPSVTLRQRF